MEKVRLPKWEGAPLLPSAFQLGEYVNFSVSERSHVFADGNVLKHGKVIKVLFSPGKVCYDLEFTVAIDNANKKRYVTRIHNVDGALCEPVDDGLKSQDLTPLSNHFSPFICKQLKHSFDIDTVEQAKNLQDFELMRVQGLGKMFIQKLRNL